MNFFKKNVFVSSVAFIIFAVSTVAAEESLATATQLLDQVVVETPAAGVFLQGRHPSAFSDQELLVVMKTLLAGYAHQLPAESVDKVRHAENIIINILKKYKVTGCSFCLDPNFAFIFDNQDPFFNVLYKNDKNEMKNRSYQASINSIGLKAELAFKFNAIFIVGTDFNFFDTNKTIELATGFEVSIACGIGLQVMYVPFKNISGGMVIVDYPLGFTFPALSIVIGGTLIPQ